jgi:hypothetical protein
MPARSPAIALGTDNAMLGALDAEDGQESRL